MTKFNSNDNDNVKIQNQEECYNSKAIVKALTKFNININVKKKDEITNETEFKIDIFIEIAIVIDIAIVNDIEKVVNDL